MIADTAIFSASPWQNDQFLGHEVMKAADSTGHNIDSDMAALEAQIDQLRNETDFGAELWLMQSSLMGNSCGTSVASSECSDELGLDADTDSLFAPPQSSDLFNSTLLNMLTETTNGDQSSFSPFDLSGMYTSSYKPEDDASSHVDVIKSSHSHSSPPTPVKRKHRQVSSENKPWSSLQHSEQLQVIEDLTKIISEEMGLREQLEVIRVINPRASVSPTDTEFVIDLDCLNDEKLHRVREYVRQNCRVNCKSQFGSSNSRSEASSPGQKKTSKKQRQIESRENRLRQRKEQRQVEKEKRSGLFRQEEVLALSVQDPGNESDIDILT